MRRLPKAVEMNRCHILSKKMLKNPRRHHRSFIQKHADINPQKHTLSAALCCHTVCHIPWTSKSSIVYECVVFLPFNTSNFQRICRVFKKTDSFDIDAHCWHSTSLWNSCFRLTQLIIWCCFGFFVPFFLFLWLWEFLFGSKRSFSWRKKWITTSNIHLPVCVDENSNRHSETILQSVTIKYYGWYVSAEPQPILILMLLKSINVSVIV